VCHGSKMARADSRDLRERLVQAAASGLALVAIERRTGGSARSISRWQRQVATGVSLAPRASPGGPRQIRAAEERPLRDQVAQHPDATLAEHGAWWAEAGHARVSRATMSRQLTRMGLPLKTRR
jgi:transposase